MKNSSFHRVPLLSSATLLTSNLKDCLFRRTCLSLALVKNAISIRTAFCDAHSSRSSFARLLRGCDCRKMKNIRGTRGRLDEAWRSSGCARARARESERQWRIASVNSRMKEDVTERGRTVRRTCGRYTVVSGLLAAGRRFERYALRAPT